MAASTYATSEVIVAADGSGKTVKRIGRITAKRQLTIPKEMSEALQLGRVVQMEIQNGALVITPVGTDDERDLPTLILEDLVAQGYAGPELVSEFHARKRQMQNAIMEMSNEVKAQLHENRAGGRQFLDSLLAADPDEANEIDDQ